MKHLKTYKIFEGLLDELKGPTKEELLKHLNDLSDSDKIREIINKNLPYDLLPDNLTVKGHLDCRSNQLTKLPDNLTVKGNLYCSNNDLTELPDNLTVGGGLFCNNNDLTELPNSLTVEDDLICFNNKVKLELPPDAEIGGDFIN